MKKINLNDTWKFKKLENLHFEDISGQPEIDANGFQEVQLPHTWFREEEQYRGLTVYRRTLQIPYSPDEVYYLELEGAEQRCKIYCNDLFLGEHLGSYATFRFLLPDACAKQETIVLTIFLDNSHCDDVSPMFGDFTVFGGLYRNANLLIADRNHFDYSYYGTKGLLVRTSVKPAECTTIRNPSDFSDRTGILHLEPHVIASHEAIIHYEILDETGATVARNEGRGDESIQIELHPVRLWNGRGDAHLYTVKAGLYVANRLCDEILISTGFRDIRMDAEKGLFLNGNHQKLHGIAKHQDFGTHYNAVTESDIEKDFQLISEIGANAVRLSHYQHPQMTYDLCDREGYLVWAEIPMLKMTDHPALYENTVQQLTELILQNLHHPSIFCWGIQNEIGMFRDAPYMHEQCRKLHTLVKKLDPERLSTAANLFTVKAKSELNNITDIIGYNVYFGWYYGKMTDYDRFLDRFHAARPNLPICISEYGVDANVHLHSETPEIKDYSEEYQALYHETVWPIFRNKAYLFGSFVWNMFDFSSAIRNEGGVQYRNAKGLVTMDRATRKDAFYYYKAVWSKEPFVHITGKRFKDRAKDHIDIKVYTNQSYVTLSVNETEPLRGENNGNGTVVFHDVPLSSGDNRILVKSGTLSDQAVFTKVAAPNTSYSLHDGTSGTAVKNWFLSENEYIREGYYSVMDTAYELITCDETKKILSSYVPELVHLMVDKDVIPLGLSMNSILKRNLGKDENGILKKINQELNQIPSLDD